MNNVEAMRKGQSNVPKETVDGVMDLLLHSFREVFGNSVELEALVDDVKSKAGMTI